MARMTAEEAGAFDELWTKTTLKVSGDGKNGFFMKHKDRVVIADDLSAAYLRAGADVNHKTPGEIIGGLVREKIAASA